MISQATAEHPEQRLQGWLEGYSLPRIDNHTEGHAWLLEAVKDTPGFRDTLCVLAERLLWSHLGGELQSADLNRLLFNLFYLCAGLRCPRILAPPLLKILKERAVPEGDAAADTDAAAGSYRSVPLVTAFRAALVANQVDDGLLPVWRSMLQGRPHDFLRGRPMDGFEGTLGLPGRPDHDEIGYALGWMAVHLSELKSRTRQFRYLLNTVELRFPDEAWNFAGFVRSGEWLPWTGESLGIDGAEPVEAAFAFAAAVGNPRAVLTSEKRAQVAQMMRDVGNTPLRRVHLDTTMGHMLSR